jgi:hypothetical protein
MGKMNGDNENSSLGSPNNARPPMPGSQRSPHDEKYLQPHRPPTKSSTDIGPLAMIPEFQENESENYSSCNKKKSFGKLSIEKRFKEDGHTEYSGSPIENRSFQHSYAGDGRPKSYGRKKSPVQLRSQAEHSGIEIPGRKLDNCGLSERSYDNSPEIQAIKRQFHKTGPGQNPGLSNHQKNEDPMMSRPQLSSQQQIIENPRLDHLMQDAVRRNSSGNTHYSHLSGVVQMFKESQNPNEYSQ